MKGKDKMPTTNKSWRVIYMEATQMDSDILPQAKKKKTKKEKKNPRRKELNLQTSIVYLLEPEISYSSVPWSSIVDHSSLF